MEKMPVCPYFSPDKVGMREVLGGESYKKPISPLQTLGTAGLPLHKRSFRGRGAVRRKFSAPPSCQFAWFEVSEANPNAPRRTIMPKRWGSQAHPSLCGLKSGNFGTPDFFLKAWNRLAS
jgi:hypothetical protein